MRHCCHCCLVSCIRILSFVVFVVITIVVVVAVAALHCWYYCAFELEAYYEKCIKVFAALPSEMRMQNKQAVPLPLPLTHSLNTQCEWEGEG